jgi:hypothetical protein
VVETNHYEGLSAAKERLAEELQPEILKQISGIEFDSSILRENTGDLLETTLE